MEEHMVSPKIQVVTAVHRLDRPIRRTVESVLACPDAASIVVAHGIDPDELDLPDSPRVEVLTLRDHLGYPGPPKNLGLKHATAPFVSLLDSDDWYEAGALDAMLARAEEHDLDIVLAPTTNPEEGLMMSPLTLRRTGLQAGPDRLFYRTAVRGLFRREVIQDPRHLLRPDLKTGEDMQPMLRMLTGPHKIGSFLTDPAYVLADDGGPRVSEAPMPMEAALRAVTYLVEDGELAALNPAARASAVTKLLRVHVLVPIERRVRQDTLTEEDLQAAARVARLLREVSRSGTEAFSANDERVVAAIASGDIERVRQAVSARETSSPIARVLPRNLRYALSKDGNLRNTVAGVILAERHTRAFPDGSDQKPHLLIISFSKITADARVLKQVNLFKDDYAVTTCGYGPAPDGVAEHIELPAEAHSVALYGRYITARQYRAAYWRVAAVAESWRRLHGRKGKFTAILANEIESLPLALRLEPTAGVLSDLHEYYPSLHEDDPAWSRRIRPYYEWLCRRHLPHAARVTTVGEGLADKYLALTGVRPRVVTNATPFVEIAPTPVHSPLRVVHHGAALRNRDLDLLVDSVLAADNGIEMDMYLMPNDPQYIEELRHRTEGSRVRVLDGVAYGDLIATLNQYDVGFYILQPTTTNHEYALPNKFYDFIQSRLAIVVGPSPEMQRLVDQYGLGVVTSDFTVQAGAQALRSLTDEDVARFKENAAANAYALSSAPQVKVWAECMREIVAGT